MVERLSIPRLALLPLGPVSNDLAAWLSLRLAERLDGPIVIGVSVDLPQAAHERRRGQYLGDAILSYVRTRAGEAGRKTLGIIDRDCYAEGRNFVFGQASLKGREAFIALPRLRQSFYGQPDNECLFRERVVKEALHEIGHTLGLAHCPDPSCVMHFSNTIADTDRKSASYCPRCLGLAADGAHARGESPSGSTPQ